MRDSADHDPAQGPLQRLGHSLANLTATIIETGETRLALLGTELQEEVYRAAGLVLLALMAVFLVTLGLVMGAFALVITFWDTHRLLVAILVACGFLVMSLIAITLLIIRLRAKPPMLAHTLEELRRDRQMLRRNA